jgi:hypothetical protein
LTRIAGLEINIPESPELNAAQRLKNLRIEALLVSRHSVALIRECRRAGVALNGDNLFTFQ